MSDGPHNWPDWWAMVKGWLNGDIPLDSLLITAVIATLRVIYTGRSWRRLLLEVPLCCLLALAAFSMIKPTPSMDNAANATLTANAERDYWRLRDGIATVTEQLEGAQGYIRTQCL